MENNIPSATHQEKAKKMKKLRRWQIAVSLLGVAIIVWGVIEVICLFLNYSQTETSNDAQIEQYVSPINLRAYGYNDKMQRYMKNDGFILHTNVDNIDGVRAAVRIKAE